MQFNWKELVKLILAAILGAVGGANVDFAPAPQSYEAAQPPPDLIDKPEEVVDDGEEAEKRYIYEAYLLCDCSEEKTIGGNGLPEYTFEDAAFKTKKVFLSLTFPLAPGLETQLTKLKACGENPVAEIIDYSPIVRRPKE